MDRGFFVPRHSRCPDSICGDRGMICADTNGLDKLKDEALKGRRYLFSSSSLQFFTFSSLHLCVYASLLQGSQHTALAITDESSKPLEQPTSDQSFD